MTTSADPCFIAYSRGRSIHDNRPVQRQAADWTAFVQSLEGDRAATKASAGYICGPLNGDGRRAAECALPRRFLAVDLDRIAPDVLGDVCMWFMRYSAVRWATHSSTPEKPRMRVLIETDRAVTRAEGIAIGAVIKGDMEEEFGRSIEVDDSTFRAEQPVFLVPADAALGRYDGAPLPVDRYLQAAPKPAPELARVNGETGEVEGRQVGAGERHKYMVRVVGALNTKGLTPAAITAAALAENDSACHPPLPADEVHAIVRDVLRRYGHQHAQAAVLNPLASEHEAGPMDAQVHQPQAPLDIFRAAVAPAFDPASFPAVLREFAVPLATAAGHDPAAYLMTGLAVAAAAVHDDVRLAVIPKTRYYESARLWVLLCGGPGYAKTPAMRAAGSVLWELHREQRDKWERETAGLGEDDKKPPMPAVITTDPTIEKLSELLHDNPRGMLALYEELDSWLGSHDAYRGGQGSKDRGEWLRLFDGGPHQVDRVKRGSHYVRNWGASVLGGTTPAGLRRHAKDFPPDGLIQRFMPVMVRPMGAADASVPDGVLDAGRHGFEERVREIFGAATGIVHMTPAATALFVARREARRSELQAVESMSEPLTGHLAKHDAMTARVALTMHMLEHGAAGPDALLEAKTMGAAINVLHVVARHALVMFGTLAGGDSTAAVAQAAARAIVLAKLEAVSRRDLIRHCRAYRDADARTQDAALRFLTDAAWLTPVVEGRQYAGRPALYAVHPDAAALFAAEGEALRARRRVVRELFGS